MVYTAGSASLAILELLVHVPLPDLLSSFVMIECRFDPSLAIVLQRAVLPKKWRTYPAPREVQSIGTRWVEQGQSAILEVPSAVVPQEQNFLLNPSHSQFGTIEILEPRALDWDPRLLR